MDAIARAVPVVPVPLVASVFVREPTRRFAELELKAEVARRMDELEAKGAHVYVPRQDRDYAIAVGLRMLKLRHVVTEIEGLWSAREEELPLLRYYAHSVDV